MVMPATPRPILKSFPTPKLNGVYSPSVDDMTSPPTPFSLSPFPFASSSRIPPLDTPHVHFPPTPIMTKMATTHSRATYDRRPIVVSPNVCELPERGERDLSDSEEAEESYFQLSSPKSGRNSPHGDGVHASSNLDAHHGRTSAPSEIVQSSRIRCHSLPDPLIRTPHPEIPSRASLRHLRRHTDPYPNPNPLSISQVPSLISDHSSSDSDSDDVCLSPTIDGMPVPGRGIGISHISLHFPGGLSTAPIPLPNTPSRELEKSAEAHTELKRLKRRWSGRSHFQGLFEELADNEDPTSPSGRKAGGAMFLYGRDDDQQTSAKIASGTGDTSSCGFSGFYDYALDGCLGGF